MPWFRLTSLEARGIRGVGRVEPGGLFNSPHTWWGSKRGYEPLADDHPDVLAYLKQGGGGLPPWGHILSLPYPNAVAVVAYHTGKTPERGGMGPLKAIYDAHKSDPDPCPDTSGVEALDATEGASGEGVSPSPAASAEEAGEALCDGEKCASEFIVTVGDRDLRAYVSTVAAAESDMDDSGGEAVADDDAPLFPSWESLRALTFSEARAALEGIVGGPVSVRAWRDLKEAYDAHAEDID